MNYVVSFALLIVAVISPPLYSQGKFIWSLEQNAPSKLQRRQLTYKFEVKLADKVKNCEDLLIDEASRWAILSCNPMRDEWNPIMGFYSHHTTTNGALYLYDFAGEHGLAEEVVPIKLMDFPANGKDFHPLGIEYHSPSQRLFVVNIARAGSRIEVFKLFPEEQAATYIKTLKHVHLPAPNSIHAISANELYVTNDHYFPHRHNVLLYNIETFGALPISPIVYVDLSEEDLLLKTVARHPFPNGIAKLNDTAYAVSSTSSGSVRLYSVDPLTHKWTQKESISVPMMPDNLSVDKDGVLYVAGHAHVLSLVNRAKTRPECNSSEGAQLEKCKDKSSPSLIMSWTRTGGLKTVYLDDKFSSACTAARDTKTGIGLVSALYDHGILTWKE